MSGVSIVFLCGSFEEGRDGIGDYVRTLRRALSSLGCRSMVLAINDSYVTAPSYSRNVWESSSHLDVVRLPSALSIFKRARLANEALTYFNASIIAIQYNPYSYSNKGIPFFLPLFFRLTSLSCAIHVTYHELWIGALPLSPIKDKLIGYLQKLILKKVYHVLNPVSTSASTLLSKSLLSSLGISPAIQAVPSNIPYFDIPIVACGEEPSANIPHASNLPCFTVGIFGEQSLPPNSDSLGFLATFLLSLGRPIRISIIGRHSPRSIGHINRIVSTIGDLLDVATCGFLGERELSRKIQQCDLAVSTYPFELVGKSGAIAAWLDHGVDVALVGASFLRRHHKLKILCARKGLSASRVDSAVSLLMQSCVKFQNAKNFHLLMV